MLLVFYEDAAVYSATDYHLHAGKLPLGFPAVLIASELWSAVFLMLPLIILLFPDGKLPPRWRMVMWAYLAVCALIIAILLGAGAWRCEAPGSRCSQRAARQQFRRAHPGVAH